MRRIYSTWRSPVPEAGSDKPGRILPWLVLALLACYANALLRGQFQFDDYNVIVNDPGVHSWAAWVESLTRGIRPLLKFTYTLNWTMGAGVTGFHAVNLLIHLLNACLVYRLTGLFIGFQADADRLGAVPLFAALIFIVHPIHTEAVTYVCGRSTSLMTLFYLAGLLAYAGGRAQGRKGMVYGVTPLFFILALGVKETAVTFPLGLLLWELSRGGSWQTVLKFQWPAWLVLLIAAIIFLFSASYLSQMERSAQFNSLQGNAATQIFASTYLLRQWFAPFWLNIDPDLALHTDFSPGLVPLVFVALLCALVVLCRHRRPWLSFSLSWLMLQLLPLYLFLPRIDIANERQMYLAGWPLCFALGIELALLPPARAVRWISLAFLLVLGSLTVMRNSIYASEITLWQDTVLKSPNKARVHNNLGYAYLLAERNDEARKEFGIALQLDPSLYQARYNLERLEAEDSSAGSVTTTKLP